MGLTQRVPACLAAVIASQQARTGTICAAPPPLRVRLSQPRPTAPIDGSTSLPTARPAQAASTGMSTGQPARIAAIQERRRSLRSLRPRLWVRPRREAHLRPRRSSCASGAVDDSPDVEAGCAPTACVHTVVGDRRPLPRTWRTAAGQPARVSDSPIPDCDAIPPTRTSGSPRCSFDRVRGVGPRRRGQSCRALRRCRRPSPPYPGFAEKPP